MKKTLQAILPVLGLLAACAQVVQPTPDITATKINTLEQQTPCSVENWKVVITSVEQADLVDDKKLVFARIGIENNDSLWGSVHGPEHPSTIKTQSSIYLTTEDDTVYGYLDSADQLPAGQLSEQDQILLNSTGRIATPPLPPEFVTLGQLSAGEAYYFNFAFHIPDTQTPNTVTIDGMEVNCIQPFTIGENGIPVYRSKSIQLPAHTYNLRTDIEPVHNVPSARKYPNLVGAELELPDYKEAIAVTAVTREGDTINVMFDFSNYSSHAMSPSFNGYIMGDTKLFICQTTSDNDCEQTTQERVQPGQTAQDLMWTFTVPESETNLMFVYAYGGQIDLNEVYRINLE